MKYAILFDLDNTLLLDRNSPVHFFLDCCARLGHSLNGDTPARLERWQLEYWARHDALEAKMTADGQEKFWLDYNVDQFKFLGITGPLEDYSKQLGEWFNTEYVYAPHVPADVRPTLTRLRDSGATLGLVSNRSRPLGAVAEEHNLADLFDFTLSAGEVGYWKPHPNIFRRALELAGAEAAAYVGDNYYADILGARGAGLTPVLIDRRGLFPDADCRVIQEIGGLL